MDFDLQRVDFSDLPGWQSDDPSPLLPALERCRRQVTQVKPHKTASLGISTADLMPAYEAAKETGPQDAAEARAFFENHFVPLKIVRHDSKPGFVTAFFEPEVLVSATRDADLPLSLLSPPRRSRRYRRQQSSRGHGSIFRLRAADRWRDFRISGSPGDRAGISCRAWAGDRLCQIEDRCVFAHVQGAARLVYPDGAMKRVTYAAKTGHYFPPPANF